MENDSLNDITNKRQHNTELDSPAVKRRQSENEALISRLQSGIRNFSFIDKSRKNQFYDRHGSIVTFYKLTIFIQSTHQLRALNQETFLKKSENGP